MKCFSMKQAPTATPAIATSVPSVWSDSPTAQRYFSARRGNPEQVRLLGRGGIPANAVQEDEVAAARVAECRDRLLDLLRRAHARRHDRRLARLRDPPDQRKVDELEGRDLERGRAETLQKVDRRLVEGRGKDRDPELAAFGEKRLVPLQGV